MSQVYQQQQQQQQQHSSNKYWPNNYHSSYISSQFNQHHHNYALAALAAANYHPQLSISPLHSQSSMEKSEQFSNASPNNQFYNEATPGANTINNQGNKLQF
jgi:hypothetical protein